MNNLKIEKNDIVEVAAPADLNGAAVTGARVKLDNAYSCAVQLQFGGSTGAAVGISFEQHDAASGGNSKALNIQCNYYYRAAGASQFTKVEVRPNDESLSDSVDLAAVFGDAAGVVVFEFLPEMLDADGGFGYLSVNVADSTAAKVMAGSYELRKLKVEDHIA